MLSMIDDGATHMAVATDTVIESWRNDLYDGYKTGEGVPPELFSQFPLVEEGVALAGFQVWPMVIKARRRCGGRSARRLAPRKLLSDRTSRISRMVGATSI